MGARRGNPGQGARVSAERARGLGARLRSPDRPDSLPALRLVARSSQVRTLAEKSCLQSAPSGGPTRSVTANGGVRGRGPPS